jgi:hypothetical protein
MHLSPGGRSRTLRAGRRYHGPLPSIGDEPGSRSSASSTHWPHETGWPNAPRGLPCEGLPHSRGRQREAEPPADWLKFGGRFGKTFKP